jgi:hypothetical protein
MRLLRPLFLVIALLVGSLIAVGAVHPLAAQSDTGEVTLSTVTLTLTRQEDGSFSWTASEPTSEIVATIPEGLSQPGQPQYGEVAFEALEAPPGELLQPGQPQYGDVTFEAGAGPVPGMAVDPEAVAAAFADACAGSDQAIIVYTVASDPVDGSILGASGRGACLEVPLDIPVVEPAAGPSSSPLTAEGLQSGAELPSAEPSPADQASPVDDSVLLPKPGRWSVDTTRGRFDCGGRPQRVPARKGEIGRITIDADGSGFELREADGSRPTAMSPDGPDGHFVGSARKRENGRSIVLDYHLVVESPELITGKLRGKANVNGLRCDFRESYRATFVGP